jgi:hypothetical protein
MFSSAWIGWIVCIDDVLEDIVDALQSVDDDVVGQKY